MSQQYISRPADVSASGATPMAQAKQEISRQHLAQNKRVAAKLPTRYLVRDDGAVYGWNEKLASNKRFRVVGELPAGFVEKREAMRTAKQKQKEQVEANRAAAQERIADMRRQKGAALLAARNRDVDTEKSAEAQAEAEESFIQTANAEALREFALTNYDCKLPMGDVHLMRDAVVRMWMGDDVHEVGEPEDWNDKNALAAFAKNKLFRKTFRGATVDKLRLQVREWLDAYNAGIA